VIACIEVWAPGRKLGVGVARARPLLANLANHRGEPLAWLDWLQDLVERGAILDPSPACPIHARSKR